MLRESDLSKLDELSIFDVLSLMKMDGRKLAEESIRNADYLSEVSEIEQRRLSLDGLEKDISRTAKIFCAPAIPEPGASLYKDFCTSMNSLNLTNADIRNISDLHTLALYKVAYFIRMSSFQNLTNTQKNYRFVTSRLAKPKTGGVPVHVFLEEKNATKYEKHIKELLGEEVRCIHPSIVSLMKNDDVLKFFALSFAKGIIKLKKGVNDTYIISLNGSDKTLGTSSLIEAVKAFAGVNESTMRQVRQAIDDSINKDMTRFVKDLDDFAEGIKITKASLTAEEDLKRLIKITAIQESARLNKPTV